MQLRRTENHLTLTVDPDELITTDAYIHLITGEVTKVGKFGTIGAFIAQSAIHRLGESRPDIMDGFSMKSIETFWDGKQFVIEIERLTEEEKVQYGVKE